MTTTTVPTKLPLAVTRNGDRVHLALSEEGERTLCGRPKAALVDLGPGEGADCRGCLDAFEALTPAQVHDAKARELFERALTLAKAREEADQEDLSLAVKGTLERGLATTVRALALTMSTEDECIAAQVWTRVARDGGRYARQRAAKAKARLRELRGIA